MRQKTNPGIPEPIKMVLKKTFVNFIHVSMRGLL